MLYIYELSNKFDLNQTTRVLNISSKNKRNIYMEVLNFESTVHINDRNNKMQADNNI
jgi:hypothetical protein